MKGLRLNLVTDVIFATSGVCPVHTILGNQCFSKQKRWRPLTDPLNTDLVTFLFDSLYKEALVNVAKIQEVRHFIEFFLKDI